MCLSFPPPPFCPLLFAAFAQDSELNGFKNLTVTDPANNATLTIAQCALTCMDANTMQISANFVQLVDDTQAVRFIVLLFFVLWLVFF